MEKKLSVQPKGSVERKFKSLFTIQTDNGSHLDFHNSHSHSPTTERNKYYPTFPEYHFSILFLLFMQNYLTESKHQSKKQKLASETWKLQGLAELMVSKNSKGES